MCIFPQRKKILKEYNLCSKPNKETRAHTLRRKMGLASLMGECGQPLGCSPHGNLDHQPPGPRRSQFLLFRLPSLQDFSVHTQAINYSIHTLCPLNSDQHNMLKTQNTCLESHPLVRTVPPLKVHSIRSVLLHILHSCRQQPLKAGDAAAKPSRHAQK